MSRVEDRQQTAETYQRSAQGFIDKFGQIDSPVYLIERAFSLCGQEQPQVLEIGCAAGRDAKEILKRTDNYIGLDISERMIAEAQQANPGARFEVADIYSYEFPEGLDIVLAFASLLHADRGDLSSVIQRVAAALNPGGVFMLVLKEGEYQRIEKEDEYGKRIVYLYTPDDIKDMLPDELEVIATLSELIRGQSWMTVFLQKVRQSHAENI